VTRRALVALGALALLAGCGGGSSYGGGDSSTSSTSSSTSTTTGREPVAPLGSTSEARAATETVLAPAGASDACGRFTTPHYLEVAYGGRSGCVQAQAPGSGATSIRSFRVLNKDATHARLTASAVPVGGPYGGEKVRVELIFATTHFRVDALHANVPVGP
jgi:hypothetical protein